MPAAMPSEAMALVRLSGGAARPTAPTSEVMPVPLTPMPEQDAADQQVEAGLGGIHQIDAGHRRERAGDDHAAGAVAVGDHAGEHGADAPDQVGDRHGRGERLAADAELLGHRRQVEPHHLPQAHGDADDEAGAQDDEPQRAGVRAAPAARLSAWARFPWFASGAYYRRMQSHGERE